MVRAISDNGNGPTARPITSFTASSATAMLPLVSRIVDDLLRLDRAIKAQREQLKGVDQLAKTSEHPDYQDELFDIRGSLEEDQRLFQSCMSELTALGINPHVPFDGTVDFPTDLNRRAVRLCWQPGEERVEYWHEIGATKNDRRKLLSPAEVELRGQEDL